MQKLCFLLLTCFYFGIVASQGDFDPYALGPYSEDIITFRFPFNDTGLYKNVEVYAPSKASGSFPVIYFSHSFAGTITVKSVSPDIFYVTLCKNLK